MTTPVKSTQASAGTALMSGQPAVVSWATGSTEEEVYIDLGFVPSFAFIHSIDDDNAWFWYNGLAAASAIAVGDGAVDTTAVDGWNNTVVPTGKFYIRANVVNTSAAGDDDIITGLKIDDGITQNSGDMYLIAWP